jgi:hypothetical protein
MVYEVILRCGNGHAIKIVNPLVNVDGNFVVKPPDRLVCACAELEQAPVRESKSSQKRAIRKFRRQLRRTEKMKWQ